jgi:hypothetical protein
MTGPAFPRNPYIGPRSFQRGERLYGRERELRALFYLLAAERVALLHAPSGAGKTSLIQAALIDLLEAEGFRVLPVMRVGAEPPVARASNGARPAGNRYLLSALQALEQPLAAEQRVAPIRLAHMRFADYLRQRPGAIDAYTREVLIFDQFEEILTAEPNDRAAKERFFAEVGDALSHPQRLGLFVLREEFLGPLEPFAHHIPGCLERRFRLDLLDQGAAQAAIRFPARDAGVEFSAAAAARLTNNLRMVHIQRQDGSVERQHGLYVEPVQLQVVCRQLWDALAARPRADLLDELKARHIAVEDLSAISDVDRALAVYYEEQVRAVAATGVRERLLRDWIERWLITSDGLRSQALRRNEATEGLPDQAIAMLIDAHLVREEQRLGGRWCELTHDRLVGPIKASNRAWLESRLHPLQRQAAIWRQQGAPASLLLRDDALARALGWAAANSDELTDEERQFVEASREAQRQAERRRRAEERQLQGARRLRRMSLVAGALGTLCVALVSAILWQREQYTQLTLEGVAAGEQKAATLVAQAGQVATEVAGARQALDQAATAQALGSPVPEATRSAAQEVIATATAELATIQAGSTSIAVQQQTAAPVVASVVAANPLIQLQLTQAAATATIITRIEQESFATATEQAVKEEHNQITTEALQRTQTVVVNEAVQQVETATALRQTQAAFEGANQVITIKPTPTIATPEPNAATATPEPNAATATPEPNAATATPEPDPTTVTPEPNPTTATPEPGPTTVTSEPNPTTVTPEPDPTTATPASGTTAPTAATTSTSTDASASPEATPGPSATSR